MFKKILNYLINSKGMSELYVWRMCEKYEKSIFSIISLILSIVLVPVVGIIVYCYIPDIEIVGKFLIAFYILILFYFFLSYIVDYSALYVWEKYYDEKGNLKTHYVRKSNPTQFDYIKAYTKGIIVGALIYIIPLLPLLLYLYLHGREEAFPFPTFYLIPLVIYYGVIFKLRKEIPPYTEWFLQYAHNNFDELLSLDCYWGLSDVDIKIQKENLKRYSSFQNISIITRLVAPFWGLICIVFSLSFVPLITNETSSEVNNEVEYVEDMSNAFPSESVNVSDVQDPVVETNETTIIGDEEVIAEQSVESEDVQEMAETESYGDVGDTELLEDEIDIIEVVPEVEVAPEDNTVYSSSDLDERAVFSCGDGSIVALNSYVEAKIAANEKIMSLCRSKSRSRIQMQFVLYKDRSIEILDLVSELSSIEDDLKEIIESAGVESVALKDGKDVNSKCWLILDIDI